jgi:NADH:ubiquinone oxidoreductase subunit F (NADH-binding)
MTPDLVAARPSTAPPVVLQRAVAWREHEDGLLGRHPFGPQSLDGYLSEGGYTTPRAADALTKAGGIERLLGRGGAAFPTSVKIDAVRRAAASTGLRPTLVANGAEGEPLSIKDRYLLRFRPHLVLEGLMVVADALDVSEAHVYIADPIARAAVEMATAELEAVRPARRVHVFQAQETYVAGEETAVVRALTKGIARPTDKPPRPFQTGVGGAPTLVLNVETLACIARSLHPSRFDAGATFLATVSGGGRPAALYELPEGAPLHEVARSHFGDDDTGRNVLIGGFFGGLLPAWSDLVLSHAGVRLRRGSLGCGSLHFIERGACPIRIAGDVAGYYAEHNARQCGMCISSTSAVAATLAGLGSPVPGQQYASMLPRWAGQLSGRGACAVPDAVAVLIRSLLHFYPQDLGRHLAHGCEECAEAAADPSPRWERLKVLLPPSAGEQESSGELLEVSN